MPHSRSKWNDRRTYDVDLIGGDFPQDFRRAIAAVAERNNLEWHWVNDGGTVGSAALEPHLRPLYVGTNFAAYSPGDRYLLAMKLFAARDRDFDDAVRLSTETGITTPEGHVRTHRRRLLPQRHSPRDEILHRGDRPHRRPAPHHHELGSPSMRYGLRCATPEATYTRGNLEDPTTVGLL